MACLVEAGVTVGKNGVIENGDDVLSALGVWDGAGVKVGESVTVDCPQPEESIMTINRKNFNVVCV